MLPPACHISAPQPGRHTATTAACSQSDCAFVPAGLLGSARQSLLRPQQQLGQQQPGQQQQQQQQRRRYAPRAEQHEQQQGAASDSDSEPEEERDILSESELEEFPAGTSGEGGQQQQQGDAPGWGKRVLQLPLQAAAILSKEDAHYLQKRGRSRWWKRSEFPRVPADSLQDVAKSPPQLEVGAAAAVAGCALSASSCGAQCAASALTAWSTAGAGAPVWSRLPSCCASS